MDEYDYSEAFHAATPARIEIYKKAPKQANPADAKKRRG
jgi:hypothetical protein